MKNKIDDENWDLKIEPKSKLLDFNFRQLFKYRDLILMFVKRDFITFYKQTILGPIWFFIQPILTTITFVVIFGKIAGLSTDGVPQIVFYLAGITIWNYFSETLISISNVFVANASIFGKVYFPRLIMPLSIVVSGLMKFGVQFCLFILVVIYYTFFDVQLHPNMWMLATPFLIFLMASFSLGLGMIFSSLTSKYKDLTFLLTFGIQLLMYASPVIYPISMLSEKLKIIVSWNPLTGIFECFRFGFLGKGNFDPSMLFYSTATIFTILIIGAIIFNRIEKSYMDTV